MKLDTNGIYDIILFILLFVTYELSATFYGRVEKNDTFCTSTVPYIIYLLQQYVKENTHMNKETAENCL